MKETPNPMKVALDATYSLGEHLSGVGIYSRSLLLGLVRTHPEVRFEFWYRPQRYLRCWSEVLPPNVRRRLLTDAFSPGGAELFHGLNQRLPSKRAGRAVVTFHDLFVLSGEYSTPEFRARFARQAREAAARADRLIAVSEYTKSQLTSLLGVEPSRIQVIHHGIRKLALQAVPREKVVLTVGAVQKRKNLARLVEAFEALSPEWQLVLAGSTGYGAQDILARVAASPARGRIQVTGYLTPEELARWYSRASIFAFPSLDEGFGMPVLEAMEAGIPVVTSNRAALPEVAGDAALLVEPERTDALRDALSSLAESESRRHQLQQRGSARAKFFTWEKAVRQTWDLYRDVLG